MKVSKLNHLVLTVRNIETSVDFYTDILGMEKAVFGDNRIALKFGDQKINLHQHGNEFEPKSDKATPGSADLCFIVDEPMSEIINYLRDRKIPIVDGPVNRTGATGRLFSIYIRDPDNNLIELSNCV